MSTLPAIHKAKFLSIASLSVWFEIADLHDLVGPPADQAKFNLNPGPIETADATMPLARSQFLGPDNDESSPC